MEHQNAYLISIRIEYFLIFKDRSENLNQELRLKKLRDANTAEIVKEQESQKISLEDMRQGHQEQIGRMRENNKMQIDQEIERHKIDLENAYEKYRLEKAKYEK